MNGMFYNQRMTCTKKSCTKNRFMDSEYCFDHDGPKGTALLVSIAWFIFVVLINLAVLAGAAWAVYQLVTWVTAQ